MATGDVLSCIIDKTGGYAHVKLSALSAGGTYAFGTLASSPNVTFAVTSPSYDNAGNSGTTVRTVVGTANVALPDGTTLTTSKITIGAVTNGPFVWGETVTQTGSGATAVVTIGTPASPLIVNNISGTPNSSGVWTGGTSGATATPTATPSAYTGHGNWEGLQGSDLWVRVALSEPIHSSDTVTITTASGWYTGATATTAFACTNQSSLAYPAVIGQWLTVPGQRFTGALTLECQAFQHYATGGKPVACVVFTATDGTNTVTQTVTSMTQSTINDSATTSPIPTSSATAGLIVGETVKQATTNATAVVVAFTTGKVVFVNSIVGTPDGTHAWVGQTSAVSITPTGIPPVANKVSVYATTINASSFNQSATVTCNFKAYPWIGNSSAVLDTSAGTAWNTTTTNPVGSIPFLADKGNSYGVTVAFVDPTSTFNTTSAIGTLVQDEVLTQATSGATAVFNYAVAGSPNQVYVTEITGTPDNSHNWTGGTSGAVLTPSTAPTANGGTSGSVAADISAIATAAASPASTVYWAGLKICAYNLANHGRDDANAGIVYFKKGRYSFIAFNDGKTCNTSWLTLTRAPGLSTNDARIIANGNTEAEITGLQRLYDMDVVMPNSGNAFICFNYKFFWMDSNRVVGGSAGGGFIDGGNGTIFTNNAAVNHTGQWSGFGGQGKCSLFRGNTMYNTVGNSCTTAVGNTSRGGRTDGGVPSIVSGGICSFNANYGCVNSGNGVMALNGGYTGSAVVGNLIEVKSGAQPSSEFGDDTNAFTNAILWHNTFVGARTNCYYNDTTPASDKFNLSVKYNSVGNFFVKSDRFTPINSTRNKNYQATYSVGFRGNNNYIDNSSAQGPFYSFGMGWTNNSDPKYTVNAGGNGDGVNAAGTGAGDGDYHPQVTSPLRSVVVDPVIPFDLAGTAIAVGGSAGVLQPAATASHGSGGAGSAWQMLGMW